MPGLSAGLQTEPRESGTPAAWGHHSPLNSQTGPLVVTLHGLLKVAENKSYKTGIPSLEELARPRYRHIPRLTRALSSHPVQPWYVLISWKRLNTHLQ